MKGWRTTSHELLINSPWVRVVRNSYLLPNGKRIPEYYVVERRDSAICVCQVGSQVLLVRQYRAGIGKETLCHPGGRLEASDASVVDGALRELLEETGLVPNQVSELGAFAQIPAVETGRVHIYLVQCRQDAVVSASQPDPTEDISTELVPLSELDSLIASGRMDCVACVAASYKLLHRTDALRRAA